MDRVSQRREGANRLYVGILTGFLVAVIALLRFGPEDFVTSPLLMVGGGSTGLLLCLSWYIVIRSYRQLNTGKFIVLHELEKLLSFDFFQREWKALGEGKERLNKYLKLTLAETTLPILFGILFFILVIWGFVELVIMAFRE